MPKRKAKVKAPSPYKTIKVRVEFYDLLAASAEAAGRSLINQIEYLCMAKLEKRR